MVLATTTVPEPMQDTAGSNLVFVQQGIDANDVNNGAPRLPAVVFEHLVLINQSREVTLSGLYRQLTEVQPVRKACCQGTEGVVQRMLYRGRVMYYHSSLLDASEVMIV